MEEQTRITRQFSEEDTQSLYESEFSIQEKQDLFSLEEGVIASFAAGLGSPLQGLASLPDAAMATRSSMSHEPGVELAGADGLHWQLVRETETLLHLGLQFPVREPGQPAWSVQLRRDGRLIATQLVGDGETAANFGGLGEGAYELNVMPAGAGASSSRQIAFRVTNET
ncbi:MAG: hypothetical protein HY042_10475 [Spirochaetia bacterium]|nr:hypothetical protein [Spirochaetia bacterium]